MRVGILSYPMLFQRDGGLQIQVRETIAALNRLGPALPYQLTAELIDPASERLDAYDLIHVFSAINGNHRIVETAYDLGLPVVLSPLLSPAWNRSAGFRARVADRLAGRLTAWNVQTSYAQICRALQLAQRVLALGEAEREALMTGFHIAPEKIRVLPNGISRQFFRADPALFRLRSGISGPFVLMAGAISPYKNQLGVVQALAGSGLPLVLIGHAQRDDQAYLQHILQSSEAKWMGALEHGDPALASAYGAAAVVVLASQGEVFPLTVLEALAAGTPVVMTDQSALHLPDSQFALKHVRWDDGAALRNAVLGVIASPPERDAVRALVADFTWQHAAVQIAQCYVELAPAGEGAASAV